MADISAKTRIVELARSFHASGSPAYELDQRMEEVAASLGKSAANYSTPTALFVAVDHENAATRLRRIYPADTNWGHYAGLNELQKAIQETMRGTGLTRQRSCRSTKQPCESACGILVESCRGVVGIDD